MKLSVIILNYKSVGMVRQCVRGLLEAKLQCTYEIIVVDNDSGDDCIELLAREFPSVRTVQLLHNDGYAAGNNAGMRVAQGEYWLILNPDIVVLPDKIEALVRFMDEHVQVGLAGPKLVNPDGSLQYSAYRFPNFWLPLLRRTFLGTLPRLRNALERYQLKHWDHNANSPVDWLLGACLIVRSQACKKVGLLDERFFLYVEDTDWCRRFWKAGFEVYYVAAVDLIHFHERLSAQANFGGLFNRITWIHIASWVKYFAKWGLQVPDSHK